MKAYAARYIKPNDRLTSFERLEIYNRQYWFRVLGGLAEDFPGLRAVLGSTALRIHVQGLSHGMSFTLFSRLGTWARAWKPGCAKIPGWIRDRRLLGPSIWFVSNGRTLKPSTAGQARPSLRASPRHRRAESPPKHSGLMCGSSS